MQETTPPSGGRPLSVRWTDWESDGPAIAALRVRAFGPAAGEPDRYDALSRHLVVDDARSATLASAARVRIHGSAEDLAESYTGQFYDLSPLARDRLPALELGRLCAPDGPSTATAALFLILAALSVTAVEGQVRLLFGCASFPGTDPEAHSDMTRLIVSESLGPQDLRPGAKAPETFRPPTEGEFPLDRQFAARAGRPALLRGYLSMGGWVVDHLVIDREFGTCHMFTALPTEAVTEERRRRFALLLGLAQEVI